MSDTDEGKAEAVLKRVFSAVMETIRSSGSAGAPEAAIFLALEHHGFPPASARKIVEGLIQLGAVERKAGPVLVSVC